MLTILLFALGLAVFGLTISYGVTVSGGGLSINKTATRTCDNVNVYEITLPPGKAGTLSTRTDDNTGVATLSASHGITTGMIVDVYWSTGMRYGMTVGTVDGNDVPLDGGSGDNLPTEGTAVVVTEQVIINTHIDGDALSILAIEYSYSDATETSKGHVDMQDSGDATIEEIDLTANSAVAWDIDGGASNVFTGNPITNTHASNGSSSNTATLKIIAGLDSTTS